MFLVKGEWKAKRGRVLHQPKIVVALDTLFFACSKKDILQEIDFQRLLSIHLLKTVSLQNSLQLGIQNWKYPKYLVIFESHDIFLERNVTSIRSASEYITEKTIGR